MFALSFFLSLGAFARAQMAGTWVMTSPRPYMGGTLLHDEFTQDVNGETQSGNGETQSGKGWGTSTWGSWPLELRNYNYTTSINVTGAACATDSTTNETTYRAQYSWVRDFGAGYAPEPSFNWSQVYKVWCSYHTYDSKAEIMTMKTFHVAHQIWGSWKGPGACPATEGEAAKGISWMEEAGFTMDTATYQCVRGCQPWSWTSWSCDKATAITSGATCVGCGIGLIRTLICTSGFTMLISALFF
jgi:hypothetical protein